MTGGSISGISPYGLPTACKTLLMISVALGELDPKRYLACAGGQPCCVSGRHTTSIEEV